MKGLYEQGWSPEDVQELLCVIDWLLELPPELRRGFKKELHDWEEKNRMPYITSWERDGIELGLRQAVATALETKYGKAGKRLTTKIPEFESAEDLHALLKIVISSQTLQEVRDHLSQRG